MATIESNTSPTFIPLPNGPIVREVAGLDSAPDISSGPNFFNQILRIVGDAVKVLPNRLKRDAIWLAPLAVLWIALWTINVMALMKLPQALAGIVHLVIFLTATYNGFLGKAVFVTVLSRTVVPFIKSLKKGGLLEKRKRYSRTITIIRQMIKTNQQATLPILIIGAGAALAVSNLLTRNNRIDKYFVCVLAAVALLDDLSHGAGSPVVKLIISGLRDIPRLIGQKSAPTMRVAYLATTGFSIGLLLAFIPGLLNNSYTSPSGIYLGIVVAVVGIVLLIVRKKPTQLRNV
ncbi:MAG: hypothetical protein PHC86_07160 [Eubacteriales bacterium]|nr:hypothetical protein [Eubacteriales bacterium]